jgi:hypothetical protein
VGERKGKIKQYNKEMMIMEEETCKRERKKQNGVKKDDIEVNGGKGGARE